MIATAKRAFFLLAVALAPAAALATPASFGFTNGTLSATADFAQSGTDLIVTLTNTSKTDAQGALNIESLPVESLPVALRGNANA